MFIREDWMLFRSINTLSQKAGVHVDLLPDLVIKELVDNALDTGANVELDIDGDMVLVRDYGAGIQGDADFIANLFSIRRPLTSSKMIRLPSRGALGNGLRVVVGAVLATAGSLFVETRGKRFDITPGDDGYSSVKTSESGVVNGTLIGIRLGGDFAFERDALMLANVALHFAESGKNYTSQTSPWWYDSESFYEMMQAAGEMSVTDLISYFRGIKKPQIARLGSTIHCVNVGREMSTRLLLGLREQSPEPKPSVLGGMSSEYEDWSHAHKYGTTVMQGHAADAHLPYSLDVYVEVRDEASAKDSVVVMVNRTAITGEVRIQRQKAHEVALIGCGMAHIFEVGRKPVNMIINFTTPYMPVTTDGKEPDFRRYLGDLFETIKKAANKAKRKSNQFNGKVYSQRDVIVDHLPEAIDKASGNGQYRYSLRQLFYAVRPYMLQTHGKEPDYNYFAQVITDIEAEDGQDLPGLYRDARGVIYHPHTGEEIPLGTLNVEKYSRPEYTFRHVLYSEKEGLFTILKEAGWPERNDCALMTSKGFASRAARDVMDLMGEGDEDIYFFCIHDSDASGTLIYQTLAQETRARGARKVHIVNLGLDPQEALEMGLQVETFRDDSQAAKRRLPVADYVSDDWADWLQNKRVELNAMTSPQFIEWLDRKISPYIEKVIPPAEVLRKTFERQTREEVKRAMASQILADAGFEDLVDARMRDLTERSASHNLDEIVRESLSDNPQSRWDSPLHSHASQFANDKS